MDAGDGLAEGQPRSTETSRGSDAAWLMVGYVLIRGQLLLTDLLAAHIADFGSLAGPLQAWDAQDYVSIAQHGYPPVSPMSEGHLTYSTAGFEPVFPALIRFVAVFVRNYVLAGYVVSFCAGAVGVVLVWRLASALRGESVGFRSGLLFMTFPGMAIAWGMLYSESVALALVAGGLLLMVKRRWLFAGLLSAVATATSPIALVIVIAALVVAFQQARRREVPAALLTAVLAPLGFLAFAGWLAHRYHDLLYWWHLQHQAWGATVDWGKSLVLLLPHFWAGAAVGKAWMEWIGIAAVALGLLALWRAKLPALVNAYCLATLALLFVSNQLGFKPRLLTWVFPVLIAVASVLRGRAYWCLVFIFVSLMPVVLLAYATLGNTLIQP